MSPYITHILALSLLVSILVAAKVLRHTQKKSSFAILVPSPKEVRSGAAFIFLRLHFSGPFRFSADLETEAVHSRAARAECMHLSIGLCDVSEVLATVRRNRGARWRLSSASAYACSI